MVYHTPFFISRWKSLTCNRYVKKRDDYISTIIPKRDFTYFQNCLEEYILGFFSPQKSVRAELVNIVRLSKFEASHLKIFFSALFLKDSLWVTGWDTNLFWRYNVFLNLNTHDMSIITKQKIYHPEAKSKTFMCLFGDYVLYAKKEGSEVHSFHTQSHAFKRVDNHRHVHIAVMCSSDHHVFIVRKSLFSFFVIILDDTFQKEEEIDGGPVPYHCNFDICVIKSNFSDPQPASEISETIVISCSAPNVFVRAVNQIQGILWQLDFRSNLMLDPKFNPCSISSSEDGEIFIADQGTNTVSFKNIYLFELICSL